MCGASSVALCVCAGLLRGAVWGRRIGPQSSHHVLGCFCVFVRILLFDRLFDTPIVGWCYWFLFVFLELTYFSARVSLYKLVFTKLLAIKSIPTALTASHICLSVLNMSCYHPWLHY